MRNRSLLLVLLAVVAFGCEEDRVEVTVVPRLDGTFTRTITLYRIETEKPGEVLAPREELLRAAREQYGDPAPSENASVTFTGEFREVPPDIAVGSFRNRGGYDVWRSRAGAFAVYRERRPGPTDYRARVQAAVRAVDLLSSLLRRMFRVELRGEEGLPRLLEFLRGSFREDLKDLVLLLSGAAGREDLTEVLGLTFQIQSNPGPRPVAAPGSGGLRPRRSSALGLAFELLVERGYLRTADLPRMVGGDPDPALLVEMVAARMGRTLSPALRERLGFLVVDEAFEAAFARARDAKGLTEKDLDRRLEPIGDVVSALDGGRAPQLVYSLRPPEDTEILTTSAGERSAHTLLQGEPLSDAPVRSLFHVTFVVPDRAWQRDHLGEVVLRGERLRDYVLWLARLPAETRGRFEAAMEAAEPGGGVPPEVRAIVEERLPEGEAERGREFLVRLFGPGPVQPPRDSGGR